MDSSVLFVIFLFGAVLVGALVIVSNIVSPDPVPVVVNESNRTIVIYSVILESNGDDIDYILRNESNLLLRGKMRRGGMERYDAIPANASLTLEGYGAGYYWNITICNASVNLTRCAVMLDVKANDYRVFLGLDSISVNASGGVVREPLICYRWGSSVMNVRMDLNESDIPIEWKDRLDKCFSAESVHGLMNFPVEIVRNPHREVSAPLSLVVMDRERMGYAPIGVREDYRYI